jgi:hypothetical protein
MGFLSLQHMRNQRSTCRGCCPPAKFRLQGLVTLLAVYSLRFRAGSISHRQRSWDSPFGAFPSQKASVRYRPNGPTYRFFCRCAYRRSERPVPQTAVPGLRPFRESLASEGILSASIAGCSLGFSPFQGSLAKALTGISPVLLPRAWPLERKPALVDCTPESLGFCLAQLGFLCVSTQNRARRPS